MTDFVQLSGRIKELPCEGEALVNAVRIWRLKLKLRDCLRSLGGTG
jgi:hypothetical protein